MRCLLAWFAQRCRNSFGVAALIGLWFTAVSVPSLADEPAWQSDAKALADGPLTSLALCADLEKDAQFFVRGGVLHRGFNKIGRARIPLGGVHVGGDAGQANVKRTADWSGTKAVLTFGSGDTLTIHGSQLSPGLAIETSANRLSLFAGNQNRLIDASGRKLRFFGHRSENDAPPAQFITPAYIAVPESGEVKTIAVAAAMSLEESAPWALFWWGRKSHFGSTQAPTLDYGNQAGLGFSDAYHADCPILVVFDRAPVVFKVASSGGIDCTFAEPGHRIVMLPLFGAAMLRAETTQSWVKGLPDEIQARCKSLASWARQYPVTARESFQYDSAKDVATFTEKINFLEIGPGGKRLAPMPPLAALAMKTGCPITLGAQAMESGIVTEFGPIVGAADTDTCVWSISGLSQYINVRPPSAQGNKVPTSLMEELGRQIVAMRSAGLLGPWAFVDHAPFGDQRGDYYWAEPGEVLHLLAEIQEALPEKDGADLVRYMEEYAAKYPPERVPLLMPEEGVLRGGFDTGASKLTQSAMGERGGRVSLFALYGIYRLAALTGKAPSDATWRDSRKVLESSFLEQNWATLSLTPLGVNRGDRPAAVVNANRTFAGAVGGVRLSRLAADSTAEQQSWWLLARAAVLRHALGKYAAWRYDVGLVKAPPDPEWYWDAMRGTWRGHLETMRWVGPADDLQQVVQLGPDGVELSDVEGVVMTNPKGKSRPNKDPQFAIEFKLACTAELPAFRFMVPELALFLQDHLRPECAMLAERVAWHQPNWYASFAEATIGVEHNLRHPSDAHQMFLIRAQVLDEKPEQLARWIDIPWVERGDLFYMHKLAETIAAYRAAPSGKK